MLQLAQSRDYGQPARWIVKVFDETPETDDSAEASQFALEEHLMDLTPGGRKQLKLQIAREAGSVREVVLERVVVAAGKPPRIESLLRLDRKSSARLLGLIRAIDHIPVETGEATVRLDDQVLHEFLSDPDALRRLYDADPDRFRQMIQTDVEAPDAIALAHRRQVVTRFRELLDDNEAFERERVAFDGRPESVWQRFLEANPWILGVSLAG